MTPGSTTEVHWTHGSSVDPIQIPGSLTEHPTSTTSPTVLHPASVWVSYATPPWTYGSPIISPHARTPGSPPYSCSPTRCLGSLWFPPAETLVPYVSLTLTCVSVSVFLRASGSPGPSHSPMPLLYLPKLGPKGKGPGGGTGQRARSNVRGGTWHLGGPTPLTSLHPSRSLGNH